MIHHKLPARQPIPKANGPVNLILPPNEERIHKYFTLSNGIEVIAVSDPKADKAAACLVVGVGSLSDPDNFAGCAHFCEHLILMGSEKASYPGENDYTKYLSNHNGHYNATTSMDLTKHYFNVSPEAFEGALDRFAAQFVQPLFKEETVEREIMAVDSEYKNTIQNDSRRVGSVQKHLFKANHPARKFSCGNYNTLWTTPKADGRNPRQELIDWWKKEYCPKRMKLAVISKEDVVQLEKWVKEKFGGLPVATQGKPAMGKDGVFITVEDHPYSDKQLGHFTFVKPVKNARDMTLYFPLPDTRHLYQCFPTSFLCHFFEHQGQGSILSYLKRRGWANRLSAGCKTNIPGYSVFFLCIDLTPAGFVHYHDVAKVVFKYIHLLRAHIPSREAFEERKLIKDILFRFYEPKKALGYAISLAHSLNEPVPREKVFSSYTTYEEYKEEEVVGVLDCLDLKNVSILIVCDELPENIEGTFDCREPIYDVEYTSRPFEAQFMNEIMSNDLINELKLPKPNQFIPEKLDVDKFVVETPVKRPMLLRETTLSRLWYKRDDQFWLPKTRVVVRLRSPLLNLTPRNKVLSSLMWRLFMDSIKEDLYDAVCAKFSYNLWTTDEWIRINVSGYTDKISKLLETVVNKFVKFHVDLERFEDVVDVLRRGYKNGALKTPQSAARYWQMYALLQRSWTDEELLRELEHIVSEDVEAFKKEAIKRLHIETLVHGSATAREAMDIQDMLESTLHPFSLTSTEHGALRTYMLPSSSEHIWQIPVPNVNEINNGVFYFVQLGDLRDVSIRCRTVLFSRICSDACFDTLRTKEQLGYIVSSNSVGFEGRIGYAVTVQSESDPQYVETRIEAFLEGVTDLLESMSQEEFDGYRQSVIDQKKETPKNLKQETDMMWARISDQSYEFAKNDNDIVELGKISKDDCLAFFKTHIHPASPSRAKMSIHMKSQSSPQNTVSTETNAEVKEPKVSKVRPSNVWIDDIHKFKAKLRMSEARIPLEPLEVTDLDD
nr:hypothetical protein L204_02377 [Cryptococcus depauperatus CBS 7855]